MHEKEEILFSNGSDLAFRLGARRRGSRRAVDQGHLAENPPAVTVSTILPSRSISTVPGRTTYILSPLSPACEDDVAGP